MRICSQVRTSDPKDPRELVPAWGPFGAQVANDVSTPTFGDM